MILLFEISGDETRETFFDFGSLTTVVKWGIFYPMALLVTIIFLVGFLRLVRIWYQGKNAIPPWKLPFVLFRRLFVWRRSKKIIGAKILQRGRYSWVMHTAIMVGFLGLFFVTALLSLHEWTFPFLKGWNYIIWTVAGEIFGLLLIFGVVMALLRRFIFRKNDFQEAQVVDTLILWLFLLLGITGFLAEALRLATLDAKHGSIPDFEIAGFVGYTLATLFLGLEEDLLVFLVHLNWFFHALLVGVLLAFLPYSKLAHMIVGGTHVLLVVEAPPGTVDFPEEGIEKAEHLSFQQLVSLDACMECHRCHNACPAQRSGEPLSPMMVVKDLQHAAHTVYGLRALLSKIGLSNHSSPLIESVHGAYGKRGITPEVLWACTTCLACVYECPVAIGHVDLIVGLRACLVERGVMTSKALTEALDSAFANGNVWSQPKRDRIKWMRRLDFEIPHVKKTESKLLWYVGDTASFDPRSHRSIIAFAQILDAAKIEVGTLGKDEIHDGDSSRRLGEAALFEMIAEKNIKKIRKAGVKKIICTSPHSYNTFKNEYPQMGLPENIEVIHYTQFLAELIETGKLQFTEPGDFQTCVTFHDPCYLSRYNNEIEATRKILRALPGVTVCEMEDHGKKSMCCGGGGGGMFREARTKFRISEVRVLQAMQTPARHIVTACPYCLNMLTDATKTVGSKVKSELLVEESTLVVLDVAELVAEAMGLCKRLAPFCY
jgi:Fe-S oxidoreductase